MNDVPNKNILLMFGTLFYSIIYRKNVEIHILLC